MNKKIIVTGHLGFLGSAFCERYANVYDIYGIDYRGEGSHSDNVMPQVRNFELDISNELDIADVVSEIGPHAIINFAAESHVDRANLDDMQFWRSNVFGARNLALAAMALKVRMVQVSTDEVYGDAKNSAAPWTESSPLDPRNPYAVTKAAAELLLRTYMYKNDPLDLVITRGCNTIGPRQALEKAIPKAISCFTCGMPFPLYETPARRMWMYVMDHIEGIETALRKGSSGRVYNLGPKEDSEAYTEEIVRMVRSLIGKGEIEKVPDREHYDLRYRIDSTLASREIEWEARVNLHDAVRMTVEWYMNNRYRLSNQ